MGKFKVGDKVRVKSLEWYNVNKDECGDVDMPNECNGFSNQMALWLGRELTITSMAFGCYVVAENDFCWLDFMLEDEVVSSAEEQRILDLTEILKGCEGVKLYSPIFGECEYQYNDEFENVVVKTTGTKAIYRFAKEGKYTNHKDAEVLLFPSKEQRDWSKFRKPRPDLPIETPCMVSGGLGWRLRRYAGSKACYVDGETSRAEGTRIWLYIVPVNKFNFNDIDSNFKSEWNYGAHELS